MKGRVLVTINITHEIPHRVTETYSIGQDNTYETIDDWINMFKKILYCLEFHPDTIEEAFNETH